MPAPSLVSNPIRRKKMAPTPRQLALGHQGASTQYICTAKMKTALEMVPTPGS